MIQGLNRTNIPIHQQLLSNSNDNNFIDILNNKHQKSISLGLITNDQFNTSVESTYDHTDFNSFNISKAPIIPEISKKLSELAEYFKERFSFDWQGNEPDYKHSYESDKFTSSRLSKQLETLLPTASDIIISSRLDKQLETLLVAASDEVFEAGVESRLARQLDEMFNKFQSYLLQSLNKKLMANESVCSDALAEALQWTSRQSGEKFRNQIVDLLSIGLYHKSPFVRDSASTALVHYDSSIAKPYLLDAVRKETNSELKVDLEDLIESLEY